MKILVVGSKGNMGSRYCAILRYLKVDFDGVDINQGIDFERYDGFIYATPTHSHMNDIVRHKDRSSAPLLIEKPISLYGDLKLPPDMKIMMINQYRHLTLFDCQGDTEYNFFKTGKDGISWDCINIIGLSNGKVELKNDSPIWKCKINGQCLDLGNMDEAYIANIIRFINAVQSDFDWKSERDYILEAHKKVDNYIASKQNAQQKSTYRDSSEID